MLDGAIIAQYQRMTLYGVRFRNIAEFAKAHKLDDDNKQLKASVEDMYRADELMTELAEAAINAVPVNGWRFGVTTPRSGGGRGF